MKKQEYDIVVVCKEVGFGVCEGREVVNQSGEMGEGDV